MFYIKFLYVLDHNIAHVISDHFICAINNTTQSLLPVTIFLIISSNLNVFASEKEKLYNMGME